MSLGKSLINVDKVRTAEELVQEFRSWGAVGIGLFRELAHRLELQPESIEVFRDAGLSIEHVRVWERIGRGEVIPELALPVSLGHKALLKLTVSEQKLYYHDGVEVLEPNLQDTRRIPLTELSRDQYRQVWDGNKFRTPAQQRTWLELQSAKTVDDTPKHRSAVVVKRDVVQIKIPMTVTRSQLVGWLQQMEGQ